ncbi:MAG TPA: carboxypeptidase-like regulatory domain-containing protein, partial [Puia sp.]|nr:carboxypeptidase-like regulatory domain-containing protein [Puia sp.]
MRKNNLQPAILSLLLLLSSTAFSQTAITISGNVRHAVTDDRVPAVSVTIKGTTIGTFTDDRGNFKLMTMQ